MKFRRVIITLKCVKFYRPIKAKQVSVQFYLHRLIGGSRTHNFCGQRRINFAFSRRPQHRAYFALQLARHGPNSND